MSENIKSSKINYTDFTDKSHKRDLSSFRSESSKKFEDYLTFPFELLVNYKQKDKDDFTNIATKKSLSTYNFSHSFDSSSKKVNKREFNSSNICNSNNTNVNSGASLTLRDSKKSAESASERSIITIQNNQDTKNSRDSNIEITDKNPISVRNNNVQNVSDEIIDLDRRSSDIEKIDIYNLDDKDNIFELYFDQMEVKLNDPSINREITFGIVEEIDIFDSESLDKLEFDEEEVVLDYFLESDDKFNDLPIVIGSTRSEDIYTDKLIFQQNQEIEKNEDIELAASIERKFSSITLENMEFKGIEDTISDIYGVRESDAVAEEEVINIVMLPVIEEIVDAQTSLNFSHKNSDPTMINQLFSIESSEKSRLESVEDLKLDPEIFDSEGDKIDDITEEFESFGESDEREKSDSKNQPATQIISQKGLGANTQRSNFSQNFSQNSEFTESLEISDISSPQELRFFEKTSLGGKFSEITRSEKLDLKPTEQINMAIKRSLETGNHKITVKLHPESLGRVDIEVYVNKNNIKEIRITVDKQIALQELVKESSQIEKIVNEITKSSDVILDFNLRQQKEDSQSQNSPDTLLSDNQEYIALKEENSRSNNIISDNKVDIMV